MLRLALALLLAAIPIVGLAQPASQEQIATEFLNLPWQRGPSSADIGGKATIKLGSQDAFLGEQGTKKLFALMGNPPRDGDYALVPTTSEDWVGVFTFDPIGYVKDDDKIDADALLAQLKKGEGPSNEERKRLGFPELHLVGWQVPPHYDSTTKRLEWGTRLRDERGDIVVNYTVRLLGRTGVMEAILVSNPNTLDTDRMAFAKRLDNFQFVAGERYSEFRQGDKVAGYGLAALIVGGAAAVATKKGLWALIGGFLAATWKIVAGVVAAAAAGLGRLFKTKKQ